MLFEVEKSDATIKKPGITSFQLNFLAAGGCRKRGSGSRRRGRRRKIRRRRRGR